MSGVGSRALSEREPPDSWLLGLPLEAKLAKGRFWSSTRQSMPVGSESQGAPCGQERLGVPGRGGTEVHPSRSHSFSWHLVCSDREHADFHEQKQTLQERMLPLNQVIHCYFPVCKMRAQKSLVCCKNSVEGRGRGGGM